MFPLLLNTPYLQVEAYGFFIALGYFAATLLARREARRAGLPAAPFSDTCFLALAAGLIGARALFVLTNLSHFRDHPAEALVFWRGGLVFYGGFLLAAPLCALYLRRQRLAVLPSFDILAPALALGHSIGRLGCFAAGCCHGTHCPYPWGLAFHGALVEPSLRGLPVHPTQLYESLALVALCATLVKLRGSGTGIRTGAYLSGYALIRFTVEIFRGDTIRGALPGTGLSTSQAFALIFLLAGSVFLFRGFRRVRRNH
jgi:phosphatidylglycerol:prolipoprotein diacylglycerol transferase